MKKPLKFVFIYSLSFFALCFTSNALCGGGKGGWNPFAQCCGSVELEEVSDASEDEANGTSSEKTSAEELIEYLHKTSSNTRHINQDPGKLVMIQKSIVMIQPLMEDLDGLQLSKLLHSLHNLKESLNENLDLSEFIHECIRCTQHKLTDYHSYFLVKIIMALASLGVNIDRNPGFEAIINEWLNRLQIRSVCKGLRNDCYVGTILMLGILRKNIRQDSEPHIFINKHILRINGNFDHLYDHHLAQVLLGLGLLKEKIDPDIDLSVFVDEFIQRAQSDRLIRINCANLLCAVMGLEMLGKKVAKLPFFCEEWYKTFSKRDLMAIQNKVSGYKIIESEIDMFIINLRLIASSGDLEGLIDEGVFTRTVRIIEEIGFPDKAREIYDIAHIFGFHDIERDLANEILRFQMDNIRERHGDNAIVPSMQRGEVTLWQIPDQRQVMMDYLAGDAWVVAADLPQLRNRMPTLQGVIRDFHQPAVAHAIEQVPVEAILARVVWGGEIRRRAGTNFPSTVLRVCPAFLDPGV